MWKIYRWQKTVSCEKSQESRMTILLKSCEQRWDWRGQQRPDPGSLWYLIKVFIPQTESHLRVFGRRMAWSSLHFRSMSQVALWSMNWRGKLHCFWLHPLSVSQDKLASIAYERFIQSLFLKRCGEVVSSLWVWALNGAAERHGE